MIVDPTARLLHANEAAVRLLAEVDGLRLEAESRITFASATLGRRWLDLLKRTASGPIETARGVFLSHRRSGKPALQIFVACLPEVPGAEMGRHRASGCGHDLKPHIQAAKAAEAAAGSLLADRVGVR